MRVLIADDEPTSRALLTGLLEDSGYEVVVATDGSEAWAVLRRPDAPKMLILDWVMPGMNGIEILESLRATQEGVPAYVIMVTEKQDRESTVVALNAGANDFISKPFDANELCARVAVGRRMLDLQCLLAEKLKELQHALDEIKTCRGILPMCARCKKIRNDRGYWEQVETYISSHSQAEFSHGICPQCANDLYPEFGLFDNQTVNETM